MRAVALFVLVCSLAGSATATDTFAPGCGLENAQSDRLMFTLDPRWWLYTSHSGAYELCAYGVDPELGRKTITCNSAGIDAPLDPTSDPDTVTISGTPWTYWCQSKDSDI